MSRTASLTKRFWRYVDVRSKDECWLWTGAKRRHGYGMIREGGKGSKCLVASRLSYELHHGACPNDTVIMHVCDNPSCVNPSHLITGTHKDNTRDAMAKGRMRRLFNSGHDKRRKRSSKLTEEAVLEIRSSDRPVACLAQKYGVSTSAVYLARSGRTWGHI